MFADQNRANSLSCVGGIPEEFSIFRLVCIFREIRLLASPYL
jgi:hypothetical protein